MRLWEYKLVEFLCYKICRIDYYKNYRRFYRIDIRNEMEKEYSFIWYKEIKVGSATHYTQPFRTKVRASNYEESHRFCNGQDEVGHREGKRVQ